MLPPTQLPPPQCPQLQEPPVPIQLYCGGSTLRRGGQHGVGGRQTWPERGGKGTNQLHPILRGPPHPRAAAPEPAASLRAGDQPHTLALGGTRTPSPPHPARRSLTPLRGMLWGPGGVAVGTPLSPPPWLAAGWVTVLGDQEGPADLGGLASRAPLWALGGQPDPRPRGARGVPVCPVGREVPLAPAPQMAPGDRGLPWVHPVPGSRIAQSCPLHP